MEGAGAVEVSRQGTERERERYNLCITYEFHKQKK